MKNTDNIKTLRSDDIKKKKRSHAITRTVIQLIFFIAMPGAFAAGFNGIKSIFESIHSGMPIEVGDFVWALILLTAFTIVFGRFFCGYACAFGSFGDFVNMISGLIQTKLFKRKKQYELPDKLTKVLRYFKYANLAFIVGTAALGLYSSLRGTSPWDVFSRIMAFNPSFAAYAIGTLLLIVVIALMAAEKRAFCRFLCPLGAFFALLPMLFPLRRSSETCIKGCDLCRKNCPADIKLEDDGFSNGACLGCEKCTAVCPRENIAHKERDLIKSELTALVFKAILFFILGSLIGLCRFI